MEDINKSLISVIKALKNSLTKLFNECPAFLYTILFLVYNFVSCIKLHGSLMVIFLCGLFLIISFALYFRRKNFTETFLSFLLGALTIFNVTWTYKTSMIFTIFTLSFIGLIFMGSCIRLAAEEESILTQLACFLDEKNFKDIYLQLQTLVRKSTEFKQLGKEKLNILQYLVYHKIPISELEEHLNHVEKIHMVFRIDINTACDFFYSNYLIFKNVNKSEKVDLPFSFVLENFMTKILSLPLHPYEAINIFNKTRGALLDVKNENKYFNLIQKLSLKGSYIEDIINEIKETMLLKVK